MLRCTRGFIDACIQSSSVTSSFSISSIIFVKHVDPLLKSALLLLFPCIPLLPQRHNTMISYICFQRNKRFNVSAKRFYSSRSDSFLCPVFFLFFSATARIILRRFGPRDSSEVLRRWLIGRFNLRDSPNARRRPQDPSLIGRRFSISQKND